MSGQIKMSNQKEDLKGHMSCEYREIISSTADNAYRKIKAQLL